MYSYCDIECIHIVILYNSDTIYHLAKNQRSILLSNNIAVLRRHLRRLNFNIRLRVVCVTTHTHTHTHTHIIQTIKDSRTKKPTAR